MTILVVPPSVLDCLPSWSSLFSMSVKSAFVLLRLPDRLPLRPPRPRVPTSQKRYIFFSQSSQIFWILMHQCGRELYLLTPLPMIPLASASSKSNVIATAKVITNTTAVFILAETRSSCEFTIVYKIKLGSCFCRPKNVFSKLATTLTDLDDWDACVLLRCFVRAIL